MRKKAKSRWETVTDLPCSSSVLAYIRSRLRRLPVSYRISASSACREDCEPFRGLQINTENAPKGVQQYNPRLNPLRKIVVWNKINPWNTERRRLSWFCCFLLELNFNLSLVASANNFTKIKELPLLSLESFVKQTLKWTGFMEMYTPVPSWTSH